LHPEGINGNNLSSNKVLKIYKQIIVSMRSNNTKRVMTKANIYILNINKLLKGVKSEISINFICSDNKRLFITTSKVAIISNLNIIKKYVKELNNVNSNDIISLRLPQSKSYLKILCISYFIENINLSISSNIIKSIIKSNYILNNIVLAFYLYIIKTSPKFDMVVI